MADTLMGNLLKYTDITESGAAARRNVRYTGFPEGKA